MKTLVIGSPRTGSWSLMDILSEGQTGIKTFYEILQTNRANDPSEWRIAEYDSLVEQFDYATLENYEDNITALFKLFDQTPNCIAKVFPAQMPANDITILQKCFSLCEMADNINYIQRQDTRQQVISYAVGIKNKKLVPKNHAWRSSRPQYKEELSHDELTSAFNSLAHYNRLVAEIYAQYPGKVYTLEKDLPQKPYQNKYEYTGDWQVPYNFKMLGEESNA